MVCRGRSAVVEWSDEENVGTTVVLVLGPMAGVGMVPVFEKGPMTGIGLLPVAGIGVVVAASGRVSLCLTSSTERVMFNVS